MGEDHSRLSAEDVLAALEDTALLEDARDIARRVAALLEDRITAAMVAVSVVVPAPARHAAVGVLGYPHFSSTLIVPADEPDLAALLAASDHVHTRTVGQARALTRTLTGAHAERARLLSDIAAGAELLFGSTSHQGAINGSVMAVSGAEPFTIDQVRVFTEVRRLAGLALSGATTVSLYEDSGRRSMLSLSPDDPTVETAATALRPTLPAPVGPPVSPRQLEVLEHLAVGLTNDAIAAELGISVNTVRTHRRVLMELFEAHNGTELINRAREAGILP